MAEIIRFTRKKHASPTTHEELPLSLKGELLAFIEGIDPDFAAELSERLDPQGALPQRRAGIRNRRREAENDALKAKVFPMVHRHKSRREDKDSDSGNMLEFPKRR